MCNPDFTRRAQAEQAAARICFHFSWVPVYHKIKFYMAGADLDHTRSTTMLDSIHVHPARNAGRKQWNIPGQFDTVLIWDGWSGKQGNGVLGS
jgi:hypothetical protein